MTLTLTFVVVPSACRFHAFIHRTQTRIVSHHAFTHLRIHALLLASLLLATQDNDDDNEGRTAV